MVLSIRAKTVLVLLATFTVGAILGHTFVSGHASRSRMSSLEATSQLSNLSYLAQFTNKRNFLNVVFVKKSWGWTSLALLLIWLLSATIESSSVERIFVGIAEYLTATLVWIVVTQGKYLPGKMALSDYLLVGTGAKCISYIPHSDAPGLETAAQKPLEVVKGYAVDGAQKLADTFGIDEKTLSSYVPLHMSPKHCLSRTQASITNPGAFSRWHGGLDISGHVFLLFIAICLIWYNVLPLIRTPAQKPAIEIVRKIVIAGSVGLLSIFWWMFFITTIFFHTISEKFLGILVAVLTEELVAYFGRQAKFYFQTRPHYTPGPVLTKNQ